MRWDYGPGILPEHLNNAGAEWGRFLKIIENMLLIIIDDRCLYYNGFNIIIAGFCL
jgi:hypothetical protein